MYYDKKSKNKRTNIVYKRTLEVCVCLYMRVQCTYLSLSILYILIDIELIPVG